MLTNLYFYKNLKLIKRLKKISAQIRQHLHLRRENFLLNFQTANLNNNATLRATCKVAFTLAEVLITIAIIGIVAIMVLPVLNKKIEQTITIHQLKEAYAILKNAVKMSEAENGEIASWDFSLNAQDFNKTYILPYLKVIKTCSEAQCLKTKDFYGYYDLAGHKYTYDIKSSYILANGMVLMYIKSEAAAHGKGFINYIVDLNGAKGKNKMGRDIFSFYLLNHQSMEKKYQKSQGNVQDGIYPGSIKGEFPHWNLPRDQILASGDRNCNASKSTNWTNHGGTGAGCSVIIIKYDNWKISKDYPWK